MVLSLAKIEYLMDLENIALKTWDISSFDFPKGIKRYRNEAWMKHVFEDYDNLNNITLKEFRVIYKEYCRDENGDDWFLD